MSRPDLILGAGISGLILSHRLTQKGRKHLLIERNDLPMKDTGAGFYYLHQALFGDETPMKVIVTGCPDADESTYAQKVYGDPSVRPVSIKGQREEHQGFKLSKELIINKVKPKVQTGCEVICINPDDHWVSTSDGRFWPYDQLHSTIPLPMLLSLSGRSSLVEFHSRPIQIKTVPVSEAAAFQKADPNEMLSHYCGAKCHSWYRYTHTDGQELVAVETTEQPPMYGARNLYPGKIWYTPGQEGADRYALEDLRGALRDLDGIHLWGRYATWTPKMLTHHVWKEAMAF